MFNLRRSFLALTAILILLSVGRAAKAEDPTIRVATFNISFNRPIQGKLLKDLQAGSKQAHQVAAILRTVRPDIVLLNEFDHDSDGRAIQVFQQDYLQTEQLEGANIETQPLEYPYVFTAEVNTGVSSGLDLDQNGKTSDNADCWGYGAFPGQYGMVVLSKYPIKTDSVRTFQKLLWSDLPNAAAPQLPSSSVAWYPDNTWKQLRLSSKSHWDVPISIGQQTLHILASHPTPPAFDGPEDRNGRRNHDEIRLWKEYLAESEVAWLKDDQGRAGGFQGQHFVICGDLNADPVDGGSYNSAIQQLLQHSRIDSSMIPFSAGGPAATQAQGKANLRQQGDPRFDTSDFSDRTVGNLRVDYVLPSVTLQVVDSRVFWPKKDQPLHSVLNCSDHRLVWTDVRFKNQ